MVTAIVLLEVQRDLINEVAREIAAMDGVSEVYSVGGRVDLVALIHAENNQALADLATNRMIKVDGITHSETLIAFRNYSK